MASNFPAIIPSPPPLVDYMNRPLRREQLTEIISQPTVSGIRSVITGHPASGLDPQRLARILMAAEQGDATRYFELAEQMEEKDLHYLGVLGQRKRAVSQLEISVEAAGDDADSQADADLARDWISRESVETELFDQLDGVGKGHSLLEIAWDLSERQWWPKDLIYVDPRFTEFDRIDGKTLKLKGDDGLPVPLPAFKFVETHIKAKSGLPVRAGLARPVAWAWMFKNFTVKDWMAFNEVYGMPLRLGKHDSNATAEQRRTLLRAVTEIGHDAAAIVDKSMDIQFVDGKAGGGDGALFMGAADWFDRQISKAVLGQTMTTDAGGSGLGSSQANVQDGVRADIERSDAKAIAASLNRDVIRPLIDFNRGKPKSGKYPKLVIGRAEQWDAGKMMPVVKTFVDLGGRVAQSVIRDRLGIPDPGKDELLLQPSAPAAPQMPQNAPGGPGGPQLPKTGAPALLHLLKTLPEANRLAIAAALSDGAGQADAIEAFVDEQLGDWQQILEPLIGTVEALAAECKTPEELRARLAEAGQDMPASAVTELLATGLFGARLAGAAGLTVADPR